MKQIRKRLTPEEARIVDGIRRGDITISSELDEKDTSLSTGARILFFDLETSPMKAWPWNPYQDRIMPNQIEQGSFILSWSAKWLGEKKVLNDAVINHREVGPKGHYTPEDEIEVVSSLAKLADEADILIGHNVDKFDVKIFNKSLLKNKILPPSPYQTVDTLKIAKKHFRMESNRLDEIGKFLKCGRKIKTDFDLWMGCMHGDKKSWKYMVSYCDQDVLLLEEVYHKLLPYATMHPNVAIFDEHSGEACSKCGSEDLTHTLKKKYTKVSSYNLFFCNSCFSWGAKRANSVDKDQRAFITKTA